VTRSVIADRSALGSLRSKSKHETHPHTKGANACSAARRSSWGSRATLLEQCGRGLPLDSQRFCCNQQVVRQLKRGRNMGIWLDVKARSCGRSSPHGFSRVAERSQSKLATSNGSQRCDLRPQSRHMKHAAPLLRTKRVIKLRLRGRFMILKKPAKSLTKLQAYGDLRHPISLFTARVLLRNGHDLSFLPANPSPAIEKWPSIARLQRMPPP
jgi:hypothetical protein